MDYRKIYEEHYNTKILPDYDIHHMDHDHYNNNPFNLVALPKSLHRSYHFYYRALQSYDPNHMIINKEFFIKDLNKFEEKYLEIIEFCNRRYLDV